MSLTTSERRRWRRLVGRDGRCYGGSIYDGSERCLSASNRPARRLRAIDHGAAGGRALVDLPRPRCSVFGLRSKVEMWGVTHLRALPSLCAVLRKQAS